MLPVTIVGKMIELVNFLFGGHLQLNLLWIFFFFFLQGKGVYVQPSALSLEAYSHINNFSFLGRFLTKNGRC